ncbi:hypothetical protein GCK72_016044 [Caenorhabditis remanei]|uniref:Uncharacterized protein n=1 Tax=Caenorhabditis remanei TaxID=31234 RepID=A0A6A5GWM2_CAERE|nr:hypothetical protein GCK72_016044 [Caenorhabditis remanei]KAF1759577.1 hypothetical protein GCK72_016044 [Caenorhabditis remanei]
MDVISRRMHLLVFQALHFRSTTINQLINNHDDTEDLERRRVSSNVLNSAPTIYTLSHYNQWIYDQMNDTIGIDNNMGGSG